jgi:hypothetical protein
MSPTAIKKKTRSVTSRHSVKRKTTDISPSMLAVKTPISEIVLELREVLGSAVIALLSGVNIRNVQRWIDSESEPQDSAAQKLRAAYAAIKTISAVDEPAVIRAWFIGMNDQLDDFSPTESLAEGKLREVLGAARAYVSSN